VEAPPRSQRRPSRKACVQTDLSPMVSEVQECQSSPYSQQVPRPHLPPMIFCQQVSGGDLSGGRATAARDGEAVTTRSAI
jgi:hypothetical protein